MILIFTRKGTSRSYRQEYGRGTWEKGNRPRDPKGADDPLRNNRADVHGSPTVNGDHFKRSRPQCVYLANVKFGKRGTMRRHGSTSSPWFCVVRDTNPIVLCRSASLRSRRLV
ncbi:unnamed protein product [Lasius platythorax]|uniref:Uncharacterized protein n=1 Tax=Lasius platythorax TaxID=488582 RepID=A0AAV2N380_9HYME